MKTYRIWPVTCHHVDRALRDAGMVPRSIKVTWTDHRRGRIKFLVKLPPKYALYAPDELRWRTLAAFSDPMFYFEARKNRNWISLSFVLDCARWAL